MHIFPRCLGCALRQGLWNVHENFCTRWPAIHSEKRPITQYVWDWPCQVMVQARLCRAGPQTHCRIESMLGKCKAASTSECPANAEISMAPRGRPKPRTAAHLQSPSGSQLGYAALSEDELHCPTCHNEKWHDVPRIVR